MLASGQGTSKGTARSRDVFCLSWGLPSCPCPALSFADTEDADQTSCLPLAPRPPSHPHRLHKPSMPPTLCLPGPLPAALLAAPRWSHPSWVRRGSPQKGEPGLRLSPGAGWLWVSPTPAHPSPSRTQQISLEKSPREDPARVHLLEPSYLPVPPLPKPPQSGHDHLSLDTEAASPLTSLTIVHPASRGLGNMQLLAPPCCNLQWLTIAPRTSETQPSNPSRHLPAPRPSSAHQTRLLPPRLAMLRPCTHGASTHFLSQASFLLLQLAPGCSQVSFRTRGSCLSPLGQWPRPPRRDHLGVACGFGTGTHLLPKSLPGKPPPLHSSWVLAPGGL